MPPAIQQTRLGASGAILPTQHTRGWGASVVGKTGSTKPVAHSGREVGSGVHPTMLHLGLLRLLKSLPGDDTSKLLGSEERIGKT
eukprot:356244-Chlamydomonas_euryale.AAC.11